MNSRDRNRPPRPHSRVRAKIADNEYSRQSNEEQRLSKHLTGTYASWGFDTSQIEEDSQANAPAQQLESREKSRRHRQNRPASTSSGAAWSKRLGSAGGASAGKPRTQRRPRSTATTLVNNNNNNNHHHHHHSSSSNAKQVETLKPRRRPYSSITKREADKLKPKQRPSTTAASSKPKTNPFSLQPTKDCQHHIRRPFTCGSRIVSVKLQSNEELQHSSVHFKSSKPHKSVTEAVPQRSEWKSLSTLYGAATGYLYRRGSSVNPRDLILFSKKQQKYLPGEMKWDRHFYIADPSSYSLTQFHSRTDSLASDIVVLRDMVVRPLGYNKNLILKSGKQLFTFQLCVQVPTAYSVVLGCEDKERALQWMKVLRFIASNKHPMQLDSIPLSVNNDRELQLRRFRAKYRLDGASGSLPATPTPATSDAALELFPGTFLGEELQQVGLFLRRVTDEATQESFLSLVDRRTNSAELIQKTWRAHRQYVTTWGLYGHYHRHHAALRIQTWLRVVQGQLRFLLRKAKRRAGLVLQCAVRCFLAKTVVAQLRSRQASALVIQCAQRVYRASRGVRSLRAARAAVLSRLAAAVVAAAEAQSAAVCIQCFLRANQSRASVTSLRRRRAATRIQKLARGFTLRLRLHRERRALAVSKMQRFVRYALSRKKHRAFRLLMERRERDSTTIQAAARRALVYRRVFSPHGLLARFAAASRIQAMVRRYLCRKRYRRTIEQVLLLQRFARIVVNRKLVRESFRFICRLRAKVVRFQAVVRGRRARRLVWAAPYGLHCRWTAATRIQTAFRRHSQRQQFVTLRLAATHLQLFFKARFARRLMAMLRLRRRHAMATCIQKHFRQHRQLTLQRTWRDAESKKFVIDAETRRYCFRFGRGNCMLVKLVYCVGNFTISMHDLQQDLSSITVCVPGLQLLELLLRHPFRRSGNVHSMRSIARGICELAIDHFDWLAEDSQQACYRFRSSRAIAPHQVDSQHAVLYRPTVDMLHRMALSRRFMQGFWTNQREFACRIHRQISSCVEHFPELFHEIHDDEDVQLLLKLRLLLKTAKGNSSKFTKRLQGILEAAADAERDGALLHLLHEWLAMLDKSQLGLVSCTAEFVNSFLAGEPLRRLTRRFALDSDLQDRLYCVANKVHAKLHPTVAAVDSAVATIDGTIDGAVDVDSAADDTAAVDSAVAAIDGTIDGAVDVDSAADDTAAVDSAVDGTIDGAVDGSEAKAVLPRVCRERAITTEALVESECSVRLFIGYRYQDMKQTLVTYEELHNRVLLTEAKLVQLLHFSFSLDYVREVEQVIAAAQGKLVSAKKTVETAQKGIVALKKEVADTVAAELQPRPIIPALTAALQQDIDLWLNLSGGYEYLVKTSEAHVRRCQRVHDRLEQCSALVLQLVQEARLQRESYCADTTSVLKESLAKGFREAEQLLMQVVGSHATLNSKLMRRSAAELDVCLAALTLQCDAFARSLSHRVDTDRRYHTTVEGLIVMVTQYLNAWVAALSSDFSQRSVVQANIANAEAELVVKQKESERAVQTEKQKIEDSLKRRRQIKESRKARRAKNKADKIERLLQEEKQLKEKAKEHLRQERIQAKLAANTKGIRGLLNKTIGLHKLETPGMRRRRQEQVAIRLQAVFRGMQVRKRRRVAATLKIQRMVRCSLARDLMYQTIKRATIKLYDRPAGLYYYYNTVTGSSSWEPPELLRRRKCYVYYGVRRRPVGYIWSDEEAALFIQGAYRAKTARARYKERLRQTYEKVWDPCLGTYFYQNTRTQQCSYSKPIGLSYFEDLQAVY